uniref:Serine palmitoyltransferase 1 n=1 Tax=Anthurium amnicola TaxID=1678845 RepID=A0A1D1XJV8_9ARAE
MGSLMAGWNSPVLDPQVVKYQRNRSFTKGEIEAYWRSNKRPEEEHLTVASSQHDDQARQAEEEKLQRWSSLPLTDRKGSIANNKRSETILEEFKRTSSWWTRSSWAFLNEPPVIEMEPAYKCPSKKNIPDFGSKISEKHLMK